MGLTKEQWKQKRIKELIEIVEKKGKEIEKGIVYYTNNDILFVKDICVNGIAIKEDKLIFADYINGEFRIRKYADDVERKYLEEILSDLK